MLRVLVWCVLVKSIIIIIIIIIVWMDGFAKEDESNMGIQKKEEEFRYLLR
jgi:hypothetical protein